VVRYPKNEEWLILIVIMKILVVMAVIITIFIAKQAAL